MEELKELVRELDADVKGARIDIAQARGATERLTSTYRRRYRAVWVAVALLAGLAGGTCYAVYEARHVGNCLDSTLGDRNPVTSRDRAAQVDQAYAQNAYNKADRAWVSVDLAWSRSLSETLSQRAGSYAQGKAFGQFIEITRELGTATAELRDAQAAFSDATGRFAASLVADQKIATAHPLGRCT